MKTEHAIDWNKSAEEIQADYEAKCLEIERLRFELDGVHSCHANCTRDGCVNRRLREKLKVAEEALTNLMRVCPAEIECHNMHHAPKHRHEYDETCPVVVAYGEALIIASEALAKIRGEE